MTKKYSNILKSDCHCGNIHVELQTDRETSEFTPRTCQCSLCKKHGASWIADPDGEAMVRFEKRDLASFYRFGHQTSDFIVCKKCGVLMIAICEIEGKKKAVINKTPMIDVIFTAPPIQTNFDGEDVESRLARRNQNWTGNVIIGSE